MAWCPKLEGKNVSVINSETGAKRPLSCGAFGGAVGVSMAGPEDVVVQCGDGRVRLWNVRTGSLKILG